MAKLGSKKRPAVVRVQTEAKAEEMLSICTENDWQVIVGIEPDKPEDISDVQRLLTPRVQTTTKIEVGRNEPCPCGSGKKYKRCCGKK